MDQLLAPGGCPWDAEQTHRSLVQYLLEETYEVVEAIEQEDQAGLREELGDLLLQVVFHSAIAERQGVFDLADVAGDVADKLIRRHPHVFAEETEPLDAAQTHIRWDRIKAAEKSRKSVLDGIPTAQPAVARLLKVIGRAQRGGLDIDQLIEPLLPNSEQPAQDAATEVGAQLLKTIVKAQSLDVDAEASLRAVTRQLESRIRHQEEESMTRKKVGLCK
jgi:XTP/dITP diphosphohydrolase